MRRSLQASPVALLATILLGSVVPPDSSVVEAAMRGDIDRVRALLQQGSDVNAAQGDGMTALHWAAQSGDQQLAEMLLYAGANVEAVTRLGDYTALHLAAKGGRTEAVETLLQASADPVARPPCTWRPAPATGLSSVR